MKHRGKGQENKSFFVVKEGDTLWSIAKKFSLTISEIKASNQLSQADRIHPMDRLKLRVGEIKSLTLN
jgi:LysM repeat protein